MVDFIIITVIKVLQILLNYFQLLCKDPFDRLGCVNEKHQIREHLIFRGMNYDLLENKKLAPPFKPTIVSRASHIVVFLHRSDVSEISFSLQSSEENGNNLTVTVHLSTQNCQEFHTE